MLAFCPKHMGTAQLFKAMGSEGKGKSSQLKSGFWGGAGGHGGDSEVPTGDYEP